MRFSETNFPSEMSRVPSAPAHRPKSTSFLQRNSPPSNRTSPLFVRPILEYELTVTVPPLITSVPVPLSLPSAIYSPPIFISPDTATSPPLTSKLPSPLLPMTTLFEKLNRPPLIRMAPLEPAVPAAILQAVTETVPPSRRNSPTASVVPDPTPTYATSVKV